MNGSTIAHRVRLFAAARQLTGETEIEIVLSANATIRELRQAIVQKYPQLTSLVRASRLAIGTRYAADEEMLLGGNAIRQEFVLIPPVSGG